MVADMAEVRGSWIWARWELKARQGVESERAEASELHTLLELTSNDLDL